MPDELEEAQAVAVGHVMASVMPITRTGPPLNHIVGTPAARRCSIHGCTESFCQHHRRAPELRLYCGPSSRIIAFLTAFLRSNGPYRANGSHLRGRMAGSGSRLRNTLISGCCLGKAVTSCRQRRLHPKKSLLTFAGEFDVLPIQRMSISWTR